MQPLHAWGMRRTAHNFLLEPFTTLASSDVRPSGTRSVSVCLKLMSCAFSVCVFASHGGFTVSQTQSCTVASANALWAMPECNATCL